MKTRLIAGIIAVVLAAVGAVVLVSYVRGADARALAGLDTVNVLVASEPIPAGTGAADIAALVDTRQLPATAVLPGAVSSLDQLTGDVVVVPLEPGEQLLNSKFGAPPSNGPAEVDVAPELQQITVLLELQRALGGNIKPGDTVGIFLSTTEPDDVARTHLRAHKVLVTDVQRAAVAPTNGNADTVAQTTSSESAAPPAPEVLTESLLITVATTAPIAERIVFAATYGSVWLSNEPSTADENGTAIIDGKVMFE